MKLLKNLSLLVLIIICINCNGPIVHNIIDYYDNGSIKTMSISKGSSIMQEVEFSTDGNIIKRNFYEDNYLFKEWTSGDFFKEDELILNYYNNGSLKSKGYMKNNKLHGHWAYYNREGELESDRYYFFGEPTGDWYSYSHGREQEVIHYRYIKGNGHLLEYYNNGHIKESTFFNDEKLSGSYQSNYNEGNIKISGNYNDGKKNGEWVYYNKLGNIMKIENYTSGLLNGKIIHYFDDGTTEKLIGQYKNNIRIGDWFWYFDLDQKSNYRKHYNH